MKIPKGKIRNGHYHKHRFEFLDSSELKSMRDEYITKISKLSKDVPRFCQNDKDSINKRDIRVLKLEIKKINRILKSRR